MDMTGEHLITAPREAVWAALNSTDVVKACFPGCDELEHTSENTMHAKVTQKIGPVKARFEGDVELQNIDAPNGYTIIGEGNGGVAGFAKGGADVTLTETPEGTLLRYEARAQVGGKLARIGSRLIDATAKKLAGKFFDNFQAQLNGPAEPEEG